MKSLKINDLENEFLNRINETIKPVQSKLNVGKKVKKISNENIAVNTVSTIKEQPSTEIKPNVELDEDAIEQIWLESIKEVNLERYNRLTRGY